MFSKLFAFFVISHHAGSERVDVSHIFEAKLPWDETLDVDVELIPNAHDGFIILLIPRQENKTLVIIVQVDLRMNSNVQ